MESSLHAQSSAVVEGCMNQLLELIATQAGWEDIGTNDGVVGTQKTTPDGRQLVRSIGTLNFSPEEISAFLWDNTQKKSWDGMLDDTRVVQDFDENFRVMYERFSAPWPVSYRDFVFAVKKIIREDGILLIAKSVEASVAEQKGVVRGEVIASGFYLKRTGERQTEMTYLICVDPKGSLPGFIVKKMGKRQAQNVNKIRHVMNKNEEARRKS